MKLSIAIRLGAMLRPQGTEILFEHNKSCAWGAAMEALGYQYGEANYGAVKAFVSAHQIMESVHACPECNEPDDLWEIVGEHLNDRHHWTRERIASWVESIEPVEPAPVSPACEAREACNEVAG